MSLPRAPNKLRTWGSFSPLLPCASRNNHINSNNLLPRKQHLLNKSKVNTRPFHSTHSHGKAPARSPLVRRSQNVRSKPIFSSDGLLNVAAQNNGTSSGDLESRLKLLSTQGPNTMREIQKQGMLDSSIDERTFMQIAQKVLESAFTQTPSKAVVERIFPDPDLIFTIGHAISITLSDLAVREWVLSACAQAGARIPLLITATRYLNRMISPSSSSSPTLSSSSSSSSKSTPQSQLPSQKQQAPIRTAILSQIETLALQDRDPRAMLIHAKVLGLRGRYAEATKLVEEVMRCIHPSQIPLSNEENLLVSGIEAPWEIYLWLKDNQRSASAQAAQATTVNTSEIGQGTRLRNGDEAKGEEEGERIIRLAALEYQDPPALVRYAGLMMQRGDWKMYEECMGKAAAAGNADACRKLGNFYYLTSLGRYPRLGRKGGAVENTDSTPGKENGGVTTEQGKQAPKSHRSGFFALLSSYFSPRPLADYRALALEWYRLGFKHGCLKTGIILSILSRENGDDATFDHVFQMTVAGGSRELIVMAQQLKSRWPEKDFRPEISDKLLDI